MRQGREWTPTSKESLWGILMSGSYPEKPGLSLQLGAALFQTDSRRDATVLLDLGTHDARRVLGGSRRTNGEIVILLGVEL